MTIELTTEDLTEMLEQSSRYGGACILKTKTTDGDDIWIAVQNHRAIAKRRPKTNAEPAPAAIATQ